MYKVKTIVKQRSPGLKKQMRRQFRPHTPIAQYDFLEASFGRFTSPVNKNRNEDSTFISGRRRGFRKADTKLFLSILSAEGIAPAYLYNLGPKHAEVAMQAMAEAGYTLGTVRVFSSAVRALYAFMDIAERMPPNDDIIPASLLATAGLQPVNRTWRGHGRELEPMLEKIPPSDQWVKDALRLIRAYGLRAAEGVFMDVHASDRTVFLWVFHKSKAQRMRFVPIETAEQRALLDELKRRYPPGQAMVGPEHAITMKKAMRRFYTVVRRVLGITREKFDVTVHGLRAEYLCGQYFNMTGVLPPIEDGPPVPRWLDIKARQYIAYIAGHGRRGASNPYVGKVRFGFREIEGAKALTLHLTLQMKFVVENQAKLMAAYEPRRIAWKAARAKARAHVPHQPRRHRRRDPRYLGAKRWRLVARLRTAKQARRKA